MTDVIHTITHKQIITITKELFDGVNCEKIEYLGIEHCSIVNVPKHLFGELFPNLRYLSLIGNKIYKIDREVFDNLLKLEILILNENDISELYTDTFKDLYFLKILSLSGNKLKSIPSHIFQHIPCLTELILTNNYISQINERAFSKLRHLNLLCINYNKIEKIHYLAFANLHNLTKLHIEYNNLHYLHDDIFKYTPNLIYLDLSYNTCIIPFSLEPLAKRLITFGFNKEFYQYRSEISRIINEALTQRRNQYFKNLNNILSYELEYLRY